MLFKGFPNRSNDGTLTISYTFKKTDLNTVTIAHTDKQVTYDGNPITIPVEEMFTIPSGAGTATYSVTAGSGEGTYADGKLTVSKAGTFTVTVNTAATDTHAAGSASATLTVNKADPIVTAPTANNLTYSGAAQELVTAGTTSGGTMQYAISSDASTAPADGFGAEIPKKTEAGTYYVWYKVEGDSLYNGVEAKCVTVTIARRSVSATVTFKVVNGSWDDDTTTDKTVTLTGYEGDTLKLTADQIPAVGSKPGTNYKAGTWDTNPADTTITGATTFTYTFTAIPTYDVSITAGDGMTKTTDSGAASQTGLSGAMTAVVYTANDGYYFPTDYSVAAVNGISVARNSYTQITVSGAPTANATMTLTAATAKTKPDAPATPSATNCTTSANNDGKLTGVTTAMEYKKSDADIWTAGTGSDITGLVPGTYYVRVKATDTTLASDNRTLTIKAFVSVTVTFKVVNGSWNEGEGEAATADKTVTLTGYEGGTLKLSAGQIPAVGTKPGANYKELRKNNHQCLKPRII